MPQKKQYDRIKANPEKYAEKLADTAAWKRLDKQNHPEKYPEKRAYVRVIDPSLSDEENKVRQKARRKLRAQLRMKRIYADPVKYAEYREKDNVKARAQRRANPGRYAIASRLQSRAYREKNPEWVRQYARLRARKEENRSKRQLKGRALKQQVLDIYGKCCACPGCPENRFEFLGIDHIFGDGTQERKKSGLTGSKWYQVLVKSPKRADLRTLCHNCNLSRGHYGYCPHEIDATAAVLATHAWLTGIKVEEFDSVPDVVIPWPLSSPWKHKRKENEENFLKNTG